MASSVGGPRPSTHQRNPGNPRGHRTDGQPSRPGPPPTSHWAAPPGARTAGRRRWLDRLRSSSIATSCHPPDPAGNRRPRQDGRTAGDPTSTGIGGRRRGRAKGRPRRSGLLPPAHQRFHRSPIMYIMSSKCRFAPPATPRPTAEAVRHLRRRLDDPGARSHPRRRARVDRRVRSAPGRTPGRPPAVRCWRPTSGRQRMDHFRQYAWQVALVCSVSRALDTAPGPTQSESLLSFIDTEEPWATVACWYCE